MAGPAECLPAINNVYKSWQGRWYLTASKGRGKGRRELQQVHWDRFFKNDGQNWGNPGYQSVPPSRRHLPVPGAALRPQQPRVSSTSLRGLKGLLRAWAPIQFITTEPFDVRTGTPALTQTFWNRSRIAKEQPDPTSSFPIFRGRRWSAPLSAVLKQSVRSDPGACQRLRPISPGLPFWKPNVHPGQPGLSKLIQPSHRKRQTFAWAVQWAGSQLRRGGNPP